MRRLKWCRFHALPWSCHQECFTWNVATAALVPNAAHTTIFPLLPSVSRNITGDTYPKLSLPNAEMRKDLAEQVVCGEFAGNTAKGSLGEFEFFGKKLQLGSVVRRVLQMSLGLLQRLQVALAGHEQSLTSTPPAYGTKDRAAQQFNACARLSRNPDFSGCYRWIRIAQIDLVDDANLQCSRGQASG